MAVASLVPAARNARTHSTEQVDQLVASIREWGWTMPVLVDEAGGIIAGHGRVLAASRMELVEIPVMTARGWSDAQKRAYILADNKLALNAGWDEKLLAAEMADLQDMDFTMASIGFSKSELAGLLQKNAGRTDPDAVPEAPEVPVSRLGDTWCLGRHRIRCGSSTKHADVTALLAGNKPHLMVTDPPYGVKYAPEWRQQAGVGSKGQATGKVLNDDQADWRAAWALFPGSVVYVWHAGTFSGVVAVSLAACKFKLRAQIVWVKTRHVLSRGDYHHQHEPCFYGVREDEDEHWNFAPEHEIATYAVKDGKVGQWSGGRKQSTVWFIEHLKSDTGHGTQKPVLCMQRPIENNSAPGQSVYEPFSGSGTTIIAAEMTGRTCLAMELHPPYIDVAVLRWQAFTGLAATLLGTGETFEVVASHRPTVAA